VRIPTALLILSILISQAADGRVMLRWSTDAIPSETRLGVSDVVITWDESKLALFRSALGQGYRVFAEVSPEQAEQAASLVPTVNGIIINPGDINPGDSQDVSLASLLRRLRIRHPKTEFLLENLNALQPKMRGTLVLSQNGVLYATSPTAQPWIDTNLALVKLERAFRPTQSPLYSFAWNLSGMEQRQGPEAADYALAIAEAGAFGADLILRLHENLQRGLAQDDAKSWELWRNEQQYLHFYSHRHGEFREDADVVVVTERDPSSFEPVNLLVRHNVSARILPPAKVTYPALRSHDVVVFLAAPNSATLEPLVRYARQGGAVVLVNTEKKSYSWHSAKPVRTTETSVCYAVGSGRIMEVLQPIADPESFAQDVRALIRDKDVSLSLWNALTVIGVAKTDPKEQTIELLNYAADPLDVQVRVKGSFDRVRFESPEHGCCTELVPSTHNGFTEFSVPSLYIAGRVHLETRQVSHSQNK
jgi:hypothetical protein